MRTRLGTDSLWARKASAAAAAARSLAISRCVHQTIVVGVEKCKQTNFVGT